MIPRYFAIVVQLPLMNLAKNIRKIRELKGLSQQSIANELGISQRQYSRLESCEADMKFTVIERICIILDIPITVLLTFDKTVLFQSGSHPTPEQQTFHEELKALYENQIALLKDEVAFLRKQLEDKR